MRIILYTGKGGVGKTSIAAATALRLSKEGKKVLVLSTDQAHSLSDSFEQKLSGEAKEISKNLWGMEIDVVAESEKVWGNMNDYLKTLLTAKAEGGMEAEELLVFPGLEELFSLFKLLEIYEEGFYDVVIVDCAPTGETLSLLKFPEKFGAFVRKFLPMERKLTKVAGPAVEKLMKLPMPKDNVFDDVEKIMQKLSQLQKLMLDKDVVSLRIVTTPEKIVIREAKRSFTCLHLYDYNVDAVIVNKVYPKEALSGYFNQWAKLQKEGLSEIRQAFSQVPKFYLPLCRRELKGKEALLSAAELYGNEDASKVFFSENIFAVEKQEDGYLLSVRLPFAKKEEMELVQNGEEIQLSIRNEVRTIFLPDKLRGMEIAGAKMEDGVFLIRLV